ncbi:hypothetical protein HMPREF9999_01667 [Alloprevotella sp. oral taxon 473 str. F0040]|nr:hypothetical protein HMPREF9999_01667 [Alloprevotella sp. oral taxon 473 str. F0040]
MPMTDFTPLSSKPSPKILEQIKQFARDCSQFPPTTSDNSLFTTFLSASAVNSC